jgi:7,8-dihydropterin-6-yl-methyl-4-(beta-D-ribofuranosyl)aminobenzene 5'-phosphate synthase
MRGPYGDGGCTDGLSRRMGTAKPPLVPHPDFWLRRRVVTPAGASELPGPSRSGIEEAGFPIVENRGPSLLLDGTLLVTGEVERTTDFERGMPGHEAWRDGAWQPGPGIQDDQAVVVNVRDKGLVVLTGCGHSGIVNIVRYAKKITGIDRVHAILGGLHLSGRAFESIIPATVDALASEDLAVLVPGHCTGWKAQVALADRLPETFLV